MDDFAEPLREILLALAHGVEALQRVVEPVREVCALFLLGDDARLPVLGHDGDAGAGNVVRVARFEPEINRVVLRGRGRDARDFPLEAPGQRLRLLATEIEFHRLVRRAVDPVYGIMQQHFCDAEIVCRRKAEQQRGVAREQFLASRRQSDADRRRHVRHDFDAVHGHRARLDALVVHEVKSHPGDIFRRNLRGARPFAGRIRDERSGADRFRRIVAGEPERGAAK